MKPLSNSADLAAYINQNSKNVSPEFASDVFTELRGIVKFMAITSSIARESGLDDKTHEIITPYFIKELSDNGVYIVKSALEGREGQEFLKNNPDVAEALAQRHSEFNDKVASPANVVSENAVAIGHPSKKEKDGATIH